MWPAVLLRSLWEGAEKVRLLVWIERWKYVVVVVVDVDMMTMGCGNRYLFAKNNGGLGM